MAVPGLGAATPAAMAAAIERVPGLPTLEPAAMADLRTLGEVADYIGAQLPHAATAETPLNSAGTSAATASKPSIDVERLMLDVVAEKTGYPVDMLEPGMDLENDLGILRCDDFNFSCGRNEVSLELFQLHFASVNDGRLAQWTSRYAISTTLTSCHMLARRQVYTSAVDEADTTRKFGKTISVKLENSQFLTSFFEQKFVKVCLHWTNFKFQFCFGRLRDSQKLFP